MRTTELKAVNQNDQPTLNSKTAHPNFPVADKESANVQANVPTHAQEHGIMPAQQTKCVWDELVSYRYAIL